jgi:hypothetical protein
MNWPGSWTSCTPGTNWSWSSWTVLDPVHDPEAKRRL